MTSIDLFRDPLPADGDQLRLGFVEDEAASGPAPAEAQDLQAPPSVEPSGELARRGQKLRAMCEALAEGWRSSDVAWDAVVREARVELLPLLDPMGPAAPIGQSLKNVVREAMVWVDRGYKAPSEAHLLSTGFGPLDALTDRLFPGALVVVSGLPSSGKSALVLNIAVRAALRHDELSLKPNPRVAVFQSQETAEQTGVRILSAVGEVPGAHLRSGRIWAANNHAMEVASRELTASNMFLSDAPHPTVAELRRTCQALQAGEGLDLVVVDDVEGMSAHPAPTGDAYVARGLKAMASELAVPVLCVAPAAYPRHSGRPRPRGGGPPTLELCGPDRLGCLADIVIFLHEGEAPGDEDRLVPVVVSKNRHGPVGSVELFFRPRMNRFDDLPPDPPDEPM